MLLFRQALDGNAHPRLIRKKKNNHMKKHESEHDKILFERSIKAEKAGL